MNLAVMVRPFHLGNLRLGAVASCQSNDEDFHNTMITMSRRHAEKGYLLPAFFRGLSPLPFPTVATAWTMPVSSSNRSSLSSSFKEFFIVVRQKCANYWQVSLKRDVHRVHSPEDLKSSTVRTKTHGHSTKTDSYYSNLNSAHERGHQDKDGKR